MEAEELTPSNNNRLKKKLKSPKETIYNIDLSESSGSGVKRKKKKSKDISIEIDMKIDKTSSSITHNADNEGNNSEELKSETNIVSQDMFEGSSNEIDITNCSTSSTERFFPLNQEAVKKRKKKLEKDTPRKKLKKHKTIEKSILETDMDENAMFSSNEAVMKEENSKKKKKHHGDMKNKQKAQDSEMKESIENSQTKNKIDTGCYAITEKTESPKKKHKKHKTLGSETDNENGSTEIKVTEKDLSSEIKNEFLETIRVKKKKKLHAKDVASEEEECQNGSMSSIVDGLLQKLDAIASSRKEEKSPIAKQVEEIIQKSLIDKAEDFLNGENGQKDHSVFDGSTELEKTTNLSSIPDSVLDHLLLKCDEIVQEDEDRNSEIEKLENDFIQEMYNNDRSHFQVAAFDVEKKRKVVELIKDTTTSVEKLKEELDITTDHDMVDQLQCIDIEVPYPLPLVHKIAYQISNAPTPEQRKALEDAGINLKLGKYTKEEDDKLKNNWLLFCKRHNWDKNNPELFLKGSTRSTHGVLPFKTFKKFVQFISHNFEDRIMYNIYLRFQRLFSEKVYKYFTPEDDAIIMEYKNHSNTTKPYADIAELLKRPRLSILRRYKQLQREKAFDNRPIKWDRYLIKKFLNNLLRVTGARRVSDLRLRRITSKEWEKVAIVMNLPSSKLSRVWSKDFYTRCLNPNYDDECVQVRNELIDMLFEKKYNDWREVDWNELAEKFDSYTGQRLYKMFSNIVRCMMAKGEHKDFRACVEYLKENPPSRRKNRFRYINEILRELENEEIPDSP